MARNSRRSIIPSRLKGSSSICPYSYLHATVDGTTSIDPLNRGGGDPAFITLENIDQGAAAGVNFVANRAQITNAVVTAAYAACRAVGATNPFSVCTPPGAALPNAVVQANAATMYPTVNGVAIPAYMSQSFLISQGVQTSDGLPVDLDGNDLPNSPEHTVHVGISYAMNLSFGILTPRFDYYWQSESFAREFNTPGDEIESWDQMNASLTLASLDGRWVGRAFVRNINDEDNVTGKYLTSDTSGFFRNYFLTDPQVYGASITYNFGEVK